MAKWLQPVQQILDNAKRPVSVFFRDDDAGWANDELFFLLDIFALEGLPIDLAIIPGALNYRLVEELNIRKQQAAQLIGLHQHGYTHANHETTQRKCEFGSSRVKELQKKDIATGQNYLRAAFGEALLPVFTPPWNRCNQDTVDCLEELGFWALSRNAHAEPLVTKKLQQIPIHIDWSKQLKLTDYPTIEFGKFIADHFATNNLTGIMLHHADMDAENLKPVLELLHLLSNHPNVRVLLVQDALE